jgi:hypothetical protein
MIESSFLRADHSVLGAVREIDALSPAMLAPRNSECFTVSMLPIVVSWRPTIASNDVN